MLYIIIPILLITLIISIAIICIYTSELSGHSVKLIVAEFKCFFPFFSYYFNYWVEFNENPVNVF